MKHSILNIKLLSDMCCGTGESNGSDVDILTAVDGCGFPIIPGKRIKGIMRECGLLAENFGGFNKGITSQLFGDLNGISGQLIISDAKLDGAEKAAQEIKNMQGDEMYSTLISPNQITSLYTCNRTQTKINDKGVSDDKSLRTLKLVEKGNCFTAKISYPEEFYEYLKSCVKLFRHIGLNKIRAWERCTAILILLLKILKKTTFRKMSIITQK